MFFIGKVEALNEWLLLKQDYEQTMCQNFLFNKMLEVILKNEKLPSLLLCDLYDMIRHCILHLQDSCQFVSVCKLLKEFILHDHRNPGSL